METAEPTPVAGQGGPRRYHSRATPKPHARVDGSRLALTTPLTFEAGLNAA